MRRQIFNLVTGTVFLVAFISSTMAIRMVYRTITPARAAEPVAIESRPIGIVESVRDPVTLKQPLAIKVERFKTVGNYFSAGNPNPLSYRLGEPSIERDVSNSYKRKIRKHFGCCQVCRSTSQLEVEHKRAVITPTRIWACCATPATTKKTGTIIRSGRGGGRC